MKAKGHGEKRSRKEDVAILALITEPTIKGAAEKTGIGETTLWRWMQEKDFSEKYKEAKRQAITHATARLRQGMTVGIETLIEMAANKKTPSMARVTAAKALVEYAMKAHEMEDLQDRIERLEELSEENAS